MNELKSAVEEVTDENSEVMEQIENVSMITQAVTDGANTTLDECNRNQQSVKKVAELMGLLVRDVKELQS